MRPRAYKVKTSRKMSLSFLICYIITPGSNGIFGKCFSCLLVVNNVKKLFFLR